MKKYIRLAIVGGRDFQNYDYMKQCIDQLRQNHCVISIVSGGARGADSLGEHYAKENGIDTRIFPPDWERYGKSAGFRRNRTIVDNCDMMAAFWDGSSRGTQNTIELARAAGKPVRIFKY